MKERIYALVCAFAVGLACITTASAMDFARGGTILRDDGFGLGAGTGSSSSTAPAPQSQTQQPASSQQQPASSTSSSSSNTSGLTEEQKQQQQNQIDKLNQQISSLQQQQQNLQQQIANTKDQKEKAAAEKASIDNKLYNTQQQIQLTNQKIQLLQNNIDETNAKISAAQESINAQYQAFKNNIRSTYMAPDYSFLEYLFGSQSFADFSVRMETITRISSYDQQAINQLEVQIEDLHTLQDSLAADKSELENSSNELGSLKSQLNEQSASAQQYISDIDAMEKAFLADTAALQQKQKEMQAEIDAIYATLESTGDYVGDGTWAWPVPGYSYISSPYGPRFQGTDFHTGMDIAGSGKSIYGARIVASGAGTVVKVQNNGSSGYGLFCIIDHGGNYTTLYAHTSSIVVSVGDVVEKGQTIGYVGNSGWVIPSPSASNPTGGSHLHFEVRINGKHQNPANYL